MLLRDVVSYELLYSTDTFLKEKKYIYYICIKDYIHYIDNNI